MSWINIPTPCVHAHLVARWLREEILNIFLDKTVLVSQDRNASYLLSKIYMAQQ